jgi:hypothetical protein
LNLPVGCHRFDVHGLVRPDFEHDPDARRLWEVRRFASRENLDIENRDSASVETFWVQRAVFSSEPLSFLDSAMIALQKQPGIPERHM